MSFREVVAEIVDEMEKEAQNRNDVYMTTVLRSYTKQLRIALKASEGEQTHSHTQNIVTPEVQHDVMIRKFREEFRKEKGDNSVIALPEEKQLSDFQESYEGFSVVVEGGPSDDTWFQVNPNMPVGANTMIGSAVYTLKKHDNGSYYMDYSEEQTNKLIKD